MNKKILGRTHSVFLKLFILFGIILLGAILFISQSFKAKAAATYTLSITITSASTDTTDGNGNYYKVEKVTVYFGDGETTIILGSLNGSGSGTVISTTDANVVNFLAYGKVITNSDYYRTFGHYNGGNGAIGNGKTVKCEDSNGSPISPIIYSATINYNATKTVMKDNITPTVSMEGWTYGESANNPSVSGNLGNGDVTYHYKTQGSNDSTYTTTKPSDAGNYTVRATIAETTNYNSATATANFTISMANITPTVSMSGWTYGESANNPTVSGNIGNGEVTYEYKAQDAADSTYVTTKPSNAGDYTVRASIAATDNSSSGVATANFTISKADPQFTAPIAKTNLEYTGSAQELVSAGSTTGGEIQYKLDSGSYSTTIPSATDIGTYTIYYKVVGGQNYNDVAESSAQATIVKGSINPTVSINNWTYGDTPNAPTISGNSGNGAVTYEYKVQGANDSTYVENVPTNAGSYTIRATIIETANYNSGVATANFTISKADPQVTPPTAKTNLEYTGNAQNLITAGSTTGGEIQYKLGDGTWTTNIPSATNVGDYTVYYKVVGNDNYNENAGGSLLVSIGKKIVTVTANNKTITYGDLPSNDGVEYAGFIGDDDESSLGGSLVISYNYGQYDYVGSYSIIPSGLTSSDYDIQFISGVLTVNPKALTVTIVSKTSTYGEAQVELESSITSGELINNDTNVYSLSCNVNESSPAGLYNIIGVNNNSNYEITFINEEGSYEVTKKDLTVTANDNTITYGEAPSGNGVVITGYVNSEDETVLSGNLSFTSTYEKYQNVGEYEITPTGLVSNNYEFTYVSGKLTVEAKTITVSINPAASEYGDSQSKLTATSDGIVNNDIGIYVLTSEVNSESEVGTYDITGSDVSDNYIITFTNGTNAYTVTKRNVVITADSGTKNYDNTPLTIDTYTYTSLSSNDEIVSVLITGSQTAVGTSANVPSNAVILKGNKDVTSSYMITYVNGTLEVTKSVLIVTADDKTIKCGDELPAYTFKLNEEISNDLRKTIESKINITSKANTETPGKYDIVLSYKEGNNKETIIDNYIVNLKNGTLYVLTNTLKPKNDVDAEVSLDDKTKTFDYNIHVNVEVKTDVKTEKSDIDYKEIEEKYVDKKSEISTVYGVKLIRTTINDKGEEVTEEIQPSDIQAGTIITIKMAIPTQLVGKTFSILHIHSKTDIEFVNEANIETKDNYVYVKTDKLSDFAFVSLKATNEMTHSSFCLGWLLFIFDCLTAIFLVIHIVLKRKQKLGLIGSIVSGEVMIFGIIAICIHVCVITIISLILAVAIFIVFLILFLMNIRINKQAEQTA